MGTVNATATFRGRGDLSGPWSGYPVYATPGVVSVPGVPQPDRPYGMVFGISSDPGFFSGPEPPGDPVVLALQAKLLKTQGNNFP
jgi:hypothetical protein